MFLIFINVQGMAHFKPQRLKIRIKRKLRQHIYLLKKHKILETGFYVISYEMLGLPLKYTGQTGRTINILYKEHIHVIRNRSSNSVY
jgi:hypothetical protein